VQGYICDRCDKTTDARGFIEQEWITVKQVWERLHYCSWICLAEDAGEFVAVINKVRGC